MQLILEKIISKLVRNFLREVVSRKRISQYGFEHIAHQLSLLYGSHKIKFVKSDCLSDYLKRTKRNELPRVLVSGGTDYEISSSEYQLLRDSKNTISFIQNLDFPETPAIRALPIGVEDFRWGRNGMPWNFLRSFREVGKLEKILVGPFGMTHFSRKQCLEAAEKSEFCDVIARRIPHWSYSRLASRYMFVACPRGNGIDTHRFWETLYRGSVPIVIGSPWSANLQNWGVPLISLSSWDELITISDSLAKAKSDYPAQFLSPDWWEGIWMREITSSIE